MFGLFTYRNRKHKPIKVKSMIGCKELSNNDFDDSYWQTQNISGFDVYLKHFAIKNESILRKRSRLLEICHPWITKTNTGKPFANTRLKEVSVIQAHALFDTQRTIKNNNTQRSRGMSCFLIWKPEGESPPEGRTKAKNARGGMTCKGMSLPERRAFRQSTSADGWID